MVDLTPSKLRACTAIQSLKALPSARGNFSLADALFGHAVATLYTRPAMSFTAVLSDICLKAFAAVQIGELIDSDIDRLRQSDRTALAKALLARLPESVTSMAADFAVEQVLPTFRNDDLPEWGKALMVRSRAGFEMPDGTRKLGPRPETQGAHALTTAIIAWLCHGPDAGLLAIVHNAHLAHFPDVPHAVEVSLGRSTLADMERRAKRLFIRELPSEFLNSTVWQAIKHASRSSACRAAVDAADFIDRTLWLLCIDQQPDERDRRSLEATLCNFDWRYESQGHMLEQILAFTAAKKDNRDA